jgi:hypothetical protein
VTVAVVAVLAVAWPMVRHPPSDGFPLSNYPMFTQLRPRVTTIDVTLGVDRHGGDVRLSPSEVGGTIEVIQAVNTVRRSIAEGRASALCDEVAARVAARGRDVVGVVVATDVYDIVDALVERGPPLERRVHARCEVPG